MERERVDEIFDTVDSKWEGDNAFKGMLIISKYTENIIVAAEHDIIYCASIDECLAAGMTEHDITELSRLNWMVDEFGEGFACYV